MELFENDYYRISLDVSVPCLEWTAKKFMPSSEFRTSEEKSLQFFTEQKTKYPNLQWYVAARDLGVLSSEDTEWVASVILPKFAALGLKKEAFVVPKSAFGKLALDNYTSDAGETIAIEVFDGEATAKQWLKT